MEAAWGREYKRGRYFHKLAGIPAVANTGIKLIDNTFFRDRMLKALYKKEQGPQHSHKKATSLFGRDEPAEER